MNRIEFDDGTIVLGDGRVIEPDAPAAAGDRPAEPLNAARRGPAALAGTLVPGRRRGGC